MSRDVPNRQASADTPTLCANCEWLEAVAAGRCRPCYQYRYRHGHDRPIELVIRAGERWESRRALGVKRGQAGSGVKA